jgi:hypothetical protein
MWLRVATVVILIGAGIAAGFAVFRFVNQTGATLFALGAIGFFALAAGLYIWRKWGLQ